MEMARQLNGEIVNADAFQLYRGMEILSAAPNPQDLDACPHHLFGVLAPEETGDAGSYLRMATPVIAAIQDRGKTPIITGGSGLYLKFLTHGPAPLPQSSEALRADHDSRPLDDLIRELRSLDPAEADRIGPHNRRYLSRALEICLLTGQKASELRDQWESATRERTASLRGILIQRPRAELHERIASRTHTMLATGAIEEVARLQHDASLTCRKAIGFPEITAFLAGEIPLADCEERINAATRQYAKRQETWFRREIWLQPYSCGGTLPLSSNPP